MPTTPTDDDELIPVDFVAHVAATKADLKLWLDALNPDDEGYDICKASLVTIQWLEDLAAEGWAYAPDYHQAKWLPLAYLAAWFPDNNEWQYHMDADIWEEALAQAGHTTDDEVDERET